VALVCAYLDSPPMVGSFVEFEQSTIRERTKAGLEEARRQGRVGGRRPKLTQQQEQAIVQIVSSEQKNSAEAALLFNIHPSAVSRLLSQHRYAKQT
jgi:DNA invertase Pin-like site-specific DNA recombinase